MGVVCLLCDKLFSNLSNVNKHRRSVHKIPGKQIIHYDKDIRMYKCLDGCEVSFKYNMDLRTHVEKTHGINQEFEEKSFCSFGEFTAWLEMTEKENNVQYEKMTGTKKVKGENTERMYFECVRSGKTPQPLATRKRSFKSQGSCKLDRFCTSQIIMTHNVLTDECDIKFYKTHYGHENELQHLVLPKSDRMKIVSELTQGIPPEKILDTIREDITMNLKRKDLITRKDICNIKRKFKIDTRDGIWDKDDILSSRSQDIPQSDEVTEIIDEISQKTKETIIKEIEDTLQIIRNNLHERALSKDDLDLILKNVRAMAAMTM